MRKKGFLTKIMSGALAALLIFGSPMTSGVSFAAEADTEDGVSLESTEADTEDEVILESTEADAENEVILESEEEITEDEVSAELEAASVEIDADTFPDENFRTYISDNIDSDGDGYLSSSEISGCLNLNCDNLGISDFTGIEVFTGLYNFHCESNDLTSLDVSGVPSLLSLDCANNNLTSLDLSKNKNLLSLYCNNNQLTDVDLSNNTELYDINCQDNYLITLDLSMCTDLHDYYCDDDVIVILPDSYGSAGVAINSTTFPNANFRTYISENFDTDGNGYLSNDEIKAVYYITCNSKSITNFKGIEIFTNLKGLECRNNSLTSLDVSKNKNLETLDCVNNKLTTINVASNTKLVGLYCWNNSLTSLNVTKNTQLVYLYCSGNKITSLNLKNNTKLVYLDCDSTVTVTSSATSGTAINSTNFPDANFRSYVSSNIDIDGNGVLSSYEIASCQSIYCSSKKISSLTGIEIFYNLRNLECQENSLTKLDVSKNTELVYLDCGENKLTSLNLSKNTKLTSVYCDNNQLTALDVSKNTALQFLYCNENKITALDFTNNTKLKDFFCDGDVTVTPEFEEVSLATPVISALVNVSTGVRVTWNKVPYVEGYRIYRKIAGGSWKRIGEVTATTTGTTQAFTDTTAVSGASYAYSIRAFEHYSENICVYSKALDNTKAIKALKQPTVSAPLNMAKGVYVQWSKSSGATGYYVFRRGSGEKWSRIATITSADKLAYLDTNVTNGKIYAYTVRAYYGSYLSSFNSTGKGIRVMSQPVLGTISNVSNGIKINWTKSVGATGYYVYRKVAGGSWSRVGTIKSVNTLTYTDKSAVAGKTYAYTVRAYNSSYVSYYNTTGKGIRCLKAPTTKLTAAKGKTTVSWTKSTGAAGYYIYRKTSTGSWAKIATIKSGSTVSYVDKTTKAGTKYYYTIRAYYGNYYSVLSNAPGVTAK